MEQLISKAITILDIGAGTGEHAFYCSSINSECNIYAFEASSLSYQLLQKKIKELKSKNITAMNYAIGHKVAKARLHKKNEVLNIGGIYVNKSDETDDVQMITIDSLNLTRCDYIKLEGIEEFVLLGAKKTIGCYKPAILFKKESTRTYLSGLGYVFQETNNGCLATCSTVSV